MATGSDVGESIPDVESETEVLDDFKARLQDAIAKMSPAKFEQFSRALLTKMGVELPKKEFRYQMTAVLMVMAIIWMTMISVRPVLSYSVNVLIQMQLESRILINF